MNRRSAAVVTVFALLFALLGIASVVPVPYVVYSPGPTVNLLGKADKREIVSVSGDLKAYRDRGDLRLLTVVPSGPDDHVSLLAAMKAWVAPSQAVYRYSDIYRPDDTKDAVQEQGQSDMVSSQDAATATALRELGYSFGTFVQVVGIQRGGPGDGALEVRDRLVSVDGRRITDLQSTVSLIRAVKPGRRIALGIVRNKKAETLRLKTVPSAADKTQSALEVSIGTGYDFPVDVRVRVPDSIGGPSAGMMFALAIYDTLTPGSLTGGADIAGTGTIDADGNVGAIGGIQQKLVGAQRAGARLFLAPASNCDEVRGGPYDAKVMRVVKVSTFHDAVRDVNAWRKDHSARLPQC